MTSTNAGSLLFRCPITERDFKSGFTVTQGELASISPFALFTARCTECGKSHELKFSDGRIQARDPGLSALWYESPQLRRAKISIVDRN